MGVGLGTFELLDEIARGRSSVVLIGRGSRLQVDLVAVKLLAPEAGDDERRAFVARARAAAGIQHRNVVKTLEVIASPGQTSWVMEHLDGVPLAELDPAAATPAVALRVLADALAGLHEVHRKVGKSVGFDATRVLLTRDGRVKLLLSRLGEGEDPRSDLAGAGTVLRSLLGDESAATAAVRKLLEDIEAGRAFQTAHALRVAVEQCAASIRPPATPAGLVAFAGARRPGSAALPRAVPREELEPTNPSRRSPVDVQRAYAADDDEPTLARRSPSSHELSAMEVAAAFGAVLDEEFDFAIDSAFEAVITPPTPAAARHVPAPPSVAAEAPLALVAGASLVAAPPPFADAPPAPPREDTEKIPRRQNLEPPRMEAAPPPVGAATRAPEAPLEHPEVPAAAPARLRALAAPSRLAAPAAASTDAGFWPSLRNRNYALLMACFVVANSGARMQTAALTWLIFKRTNDPIFLGWFGLAFAVPMLLLAPLGGILADRVERVRLLRIVKGLYAVLSIGLVLVHRANLLGVGPILAAQALSAVFLAFEHPTRLSLVPDFVPRKHLQNALAVNGIVNYATVFAGPALAGWLLEPRGAAFVFVAAAVASLAGIGLLSIVATSPPRVARSEKLRELFFGGLKHVRGDGPVVALLVLAAIVGVSARTYPELLPIFAQRTWGAGAKGYGLLASASGIGGTLSVVALSFSPNLKGKDVVLVASVAGLCASLAVFAFMRSMNVAAAILVVAGAFATVFQNLGTNFIAARVPPSVLGRVLGLYTITLFGVPGFGMIALTAVARKTSGATALLGAVAISVVALLATAYPLMSRKPLPRRR